MIERVAPGRILVPASMVLGIAAVGLATAQAPLAGVARASLGIRVQVVEACAISVAPAGGVDQSCGGGQEGLAQPAAAPAQPAAAPAMAPSREEGPPGEEEDGRVRYITLTY